MIGIRPERAHGHTGTETRSRLLREAAVGNFAQCKLLSIGTIMTVPEEEAPANFVPAAAVIRGGQALFGIIGRKGSVGGFVSRV
jgi:hypothetical protein